MKRWGLALVLFAFVLAAAVPGTAHARTSAPVGCKITPLGVDSAPVAPANGSCGGVRPGAAVYTWRGGPCTFNFLFDGSDGERYIGTAGHCLVAGGETTTFADPAAKDASGAHIGDAVYAVANGFNGSGPGVATDFGLIKLNAAGRAVANPAMCHFGGPTGVDVVRGAGEIVHHYGNGRVIGEVMSGRSAVTFGAGLMAGPNMFEFTGDIASGGDSGSPIIDHDGNAVGVLVAGVDLANTKPYYSFHGGTPSIGSHIGYHYRRAASALGITLTLVTAPTAPATEL
jgi:hypothetical protein